jgi:predicted nucleotidyltransferase
MKLWQKESPRRVKPLLYIYRVLLTGIHLMRTGKLEANLRNLNEVFALPYVPPLIERKLEGVEKGKLKGDDLAFHEREYARLVAELESARDHTALPDQPAGRAELNDLLKRLRKG